MKLTQGCTRKVFVFDAFVVKVPNPRYSWRNFLQGLLANMGERDTFRWNSGRYEKGDSHLLCPVLWASWGGWVIVMKRANTPVFYDELGNPLDYSKWIVAGFGGDDKPDNYGMINGRVVKIDYGQ